MIWKWRERGRKPGLDADVVENTPCTTTRENGGKPSLPVANFRWNGYCAHHPFGSHGTCTRVRKKRGKQLRMRAPYSSKGTPKRSRDVWWRHVRWKGPTRADIEQLPVAHARTPPFQGNPKGVTWRLMTSLPVKKALLGRNFRLRMRTTYFR